MTGTKKKRPFTVSFSLFGSKLAVNLFHMDKNNSCSPHVK